MNRAIAEHTVSKAHSSPQPAAPLRTLQAEVLESPGNGSQCACGGGCPRCTGSLNVPGNKSLIQRKPFVSSSKSSGEQEADFVADKVMKPGTSLPFISGLAAPRHESSMNAGLDVEAAAGVTGRAGEAMPEGVRSYFEPRFGYDFGQVRLHTDSEAAKGAQAVAARAYALGNNIVFGAGKYEPDTLQGKRLIAHELTHVIQNQTSADAGAGNICREEAAKPAPSDSTPKESPDVDKKSVKEKESQPNTAQVEAVNKMLRKPELRNFFKEVLDDIRQKTAFSAEENQQFKLKGTESASYAAAMSAFTLPFSGTGGLKYGAGNELSTFGKYLSAVEPLTPSNSIKTDLISRIAGFRVDEYLASPTFKKRLTDHPETILMLAYIAQVLLSSKTLYSNANNPEPDAGGFVDNEVLPHFGLAMLAAGLVFKEQLKAPGIFDIGPILTPANPYYANDTFFGGNLPSGFNLDAASGAAGTGSLLHYSGALNLAKLKQFIALDPAIKLDAADLDDPAKYRGWQGSLFGEYQSLSPTPELSQAGRVADRRFRGGAILGDRGLFALGEIGGHFSGQDAQKLTSLFVTGGVAYAPPDGSALKKIGFKVTHLNWKAGDTLAPRDAAGAASDGSATRVSPFASFEFHPGAGQTLAAGASAGITTQDGSVKLSDFRADLSYTYLGATGTPSLPAFRIELSGSGSKVDYFDPNSATLYGFRGKVQTGSAFVGTQVNFGADKIPEWRAAEQLDPRTDKAAQITPGPSVLVVVGGLF